MTAILRRKPLIFMTHAGLFILILVLGTIGASMLDETRGLALAESHIRELVVGPEGRVYALTSDGLFVTNGDDAWRKLDQFPGIPVSLAVAPNEPQMLLPDIHLTGLIGPGTAAKAGITSALV